MPTIVLEREEKAQRVCKAGVGISALWAITRLILQEELNTSQAGKTQLTKHSDTPNSRSS